MRILFEIVHPADVLFFYRPIEKLRARGARIAIASRRKDIAIDLLDRLRLPHDVISHAGRGAAGLAFELIARDARLLGLAMRFRPDVIAGFGAVCASHVGRLLGIPAIGFYDSEHAGLQIGLTLPFVAEWHVPDCWAGRIAPGRTFRFRGFKELSYLHPEEFVPDEARAAAAGYDASRDNYFLRLVDYRANHDLGKAGLGLDLVETIVRRLAARGRVHISSEADLPPSLEVHRFRGDSLAVHHLLAKCRLYVGESASMAAEAAVLGVPAIFAANFPLGYIDRMVAAGMVVKAGDGMASVSAAIDTALTIDRATWAKRHRELLQNTDNVAAYVVEQVERVGAARHRHALKTAAAS